MENHIVNVKRLLVGRRLWALVFAVSAGACTANEYRCLRSQECVAKEGGFGMCVTGHCAVLDATCPLDWPWRYDDAAGDLANQCASRPVPDAGVQADAAAPRVDAATSLVDATTSLTDAGGP